MRLIVTGLMLLTLASALPAAGQVLKVVDKATAEHYLWGGVNDGWYLLKRDDLTIILERIVPGGAEVKHYHRKARQFFQVLSGGLTINIAGQDVLLHPGQGIEVPPGVPHQTKNLTDKPVEFVTTSMPMSHGDRVDLPH